MAGKVTTKIEYVAFGVFAIIGIGYWLSRLVTRIEAFGVKESIELFAAFVVLDTINKYRLRAGFGRKNFFLRGQRPVFMVLLLISLCLYIPRYEASRSAETNNVTAHESVKEQVIAPKSANPA